MGKEKKTWAVFRFVFTNVVQYFEKNWKMNETFSVPASKHWAGRKKRNVGLFDIMSTFLRNVKRKGEK